MDGWAASNVFAADSGAFEGLQLARMGSGVASLYQDVRLPDASRNPLLLSFNLLLSDPAAIVSDMTAEVLWLDANKNRIGTGLRLFVPRGESSPSPGRHISA
ncbi:MAG: hypothetical protein ACOX8W_08965 [bacterium]|jgi:hypothetical protein